MELYIIRHGETEWNKKRLLQGQSNIQLNEKGRELARLTGRAIKDISFDKIYASPLDRAAETAEIITGRTDIIKDNRLKEICFGIGEGVPSEQLGETFTSFFFAPENYVPPEGGETYQELIARAENFLEECIYPDREKLCRVLIVAHGAMNKAIMLCLKGLKVSDFWKGEFQKNCCVNIYELSENRVRIIQEAKIYYDDETTDYLKP